MTTSATPLHDPESRLAHDDHEALRLWLRLFTSTTMVQRTVDSALKREFGSSLPRFDLLAQLHRAPDGMRWVKIATLRDEAFPNVMRKVIAHGLGA